MQRPLAIAVWTALAVAVTAVHGFSLTSAVDAAACAVLVAVTVTDLERRVIPNRIIVPALVVMLVVQTARDPSAEWALAALAALGFFFASALVYPAGLGMGDVKLAAFLGAWLGWPAFLALFAGSLLSLVPAVVILVRHGAAGRKMGIPFGPFLAAGAVVTLFFGDALIDRWLGV